MLSPSSPTPHWAAPSAAPADPKFLCVTACRERGGDDVMRLLHRERETWFYPERFQTRTLREHENRHLDTEEHVRKKNEKEIKTAYSMVMLFSLQTHHLSITPCRVLGGGCIQTVISAVPILSQVSQSLLPHLW